MIEEFYILDVELTDEYKAKVAKLRKHYGRELVFDYYRDQAFLHHANAYAMSGEKGYAAKVRTLVHTLQGHFGEHLAHQLEWGKTAEEIIATISFQRFIKSSFILSSSFFRFLAFT
jgi:hypothetical protein